MSKMNLIVIGLILMAVSLSCKSFLPTTATDTAKGPPIDFTTPGKSLDVKVELDKKRTNSRKVSKSGGSVSLVAADGSKFTLDVPANALETETEITMTAVKSLDGAPLDNNTPTAVQLEPSGLFFKELATLTIVPAKEIPIKEQIIFGYEGEGKDYHLALIDHKSKDIKIKLMHFSGAGVGSGSDAAWAANLVIQANTAKTRFEQKLAETLTPARQKILLGGEDSVDEQELKKRVKSLIDQFEDQAVRKKMAAAELDCTHAQDAFADLVWLERMRQLLGISAPESDTAKIFEEKALKLKEIGAKCKGSYHIVGGLDDWRTSTKVCDIMKPFTLTGGGFTNKFSGGMTGTYSYTGPFNAKGTGTYTISLPDGLGKPGTMTGQGDGSVTGGYTGSGTEKYTLTPIEPCS